MSSAPFSDVRVVDVGTMVGGPFTASLLGDFGAEVIKIEKPRDGDPWRDVQPHKDGVPLWWKVTSRNKKAVTLDLRVADGRALFLRLLERSDVLVESFRPGTLERWDLGLDELHAANPKLIVVRVSGFGQTGPYRERAGFGRNAEAMSGLAHLTGHVDGPPLHAGLPLADYTAGLFSAFGVAAALHVRATREDFQGEVIDTALYEAMARLIEFAVPEFDHLGRVPGRLGNTNGYTAPANTYRTADERWITLTASTTRIARRLFAAVGRPELIDDPKFATVSERLRNQPELDAIIGGWIGDRRVDQVESGFNANSVPFAVVYTVSDLLADPHAQARQVVVDVADEDLGSIRMPSPVPRLANHPGSVRWAGPRLAQHNREVFGDLLGLTDAELADLEGRGVI